MVFLRYSTTPLSYDVLLTYYFQMMLHSLASNSTVKRSITIYAPTLFSVQFILHTQNCCCIFYGQSPRFKGQYNYISCSVAFETQRQAVRFSERLFDSNRSNWSRNPVSWEVRQHRCGNHKLFTGQQLKSRTDWQKWRNATDDGTQHLLHGKSTAVGRCHQSITA